MTEGALEADEVSKVIEETTLLEATSVRVRPGECLVLRGPNGSGKTTLLRILAGRTDPTTGTVTLDGTPVDERKPLTRNTIAALLGTPASYPDLTLRDHLTLLDATWGGDVDTCAERVAGALEELTIGALAGRFPHELSSGQGQLFQLALILFRPSRILLLDEPEQRLDTDRRRLVTDLLAARRDAGKALVLACHDPVMTGALADEIIDLKG
ncbi:MAG: ABC transporter ATP-binding protein [Tetrasphaera sp.]|nr:ABC transporter ATP-binding protein [Tetrasphaera sp.]